MKEWDTKVIPMKVNEKLEEYGLKKTCSSENPINSDDGLADSFWKAAFDLAVDTGVLCTATQRVISFKESELREAIRKAPTKHSRGEGRDAIVISPRMPEDKKIGIVKSGPFGIPVSESLWIPVHQSCAQYREIDYIVPGNLYTVYGKELKTRSPHESLAGHLEAVLTKEALKMAGRPSMPVDGVETSPTEYGHLSGFGTPGGYSPNNNDAVVLMHAELKTGFSALYKVAHSLVCNAQIHAGYWSFIGGYAGGPEGATLVSIAAAILQLLTSQASMVSGSVMDMRYIGNCGRDAVWANSVSWQAQSRNMRRLSFGIGNPVSGACTDMLLHEAIVGYLNCAVSGNAFPTGIRTAGGNQRDCTTGLESKFAAEVYKTSCGVKRPDANEIVKKILPKYEDQLTKPPKGKSFTECFDLKTLKPTKEWQEIYDRVWIELEDLGLQRYTNHSVD